MHRLSRFMACGILVPRLGIELISLGLQDKFPTSKPPGKSPSRFFFKLSFKAPLTDRDTHPGTGVVRRKIVNSEFHSSAPGGETTPRGCVLGLVPAWLPFRDRTGPPVSPGWARCCVFWL